MNGEHEIGILELTAWFCGDRPGAAGERIRSHVETCVLCRTRLDTMRRDKQSFLSAAPLPDRNAIAANPRAPSRNLRTTWYALAATVALCVGAGLMMRSATREDSYRIKGDVSIKMYVLTQAENAVERPEHVYYPGERVQLTYSSGGQNRLVLLSVDDSGKITTYYPADADSSIALTPARDHPLPNSILLDNYIGHELFVAWFTRQAVQVDSVRAAILAAYASAGALERTVIHAPKGVVVRTILIRKEEGGR